MFNKRSLTMFVYTGKHPCLYTEPQDESLFDSVCAQVLMHDQGTPALSLR